MSPAEDALLLLRVVQRHLGSLRGTVNNPDFADEDWGFLAQRCVEKMLKALLVLQDMEPPRIHALDQLHRMMREAGIRVNVPVVLLKLEDFAVLARYEADPTPLPASREALHLCCHPPAPFTELSDASQRGAGAAFPECGRGSPVAVPGTTAPPGAAARPPGQA